MRELPPRSAAGGVPHSAAKAVGRIEPCGVCTPMSEVSTASWSATLTQGPLLRPEEAAHVLSVKTSWVYEAVRSGRVHPNRRVRDVHVPMFGHPDETGAFDSRRRRCDLRDTVSSTA
jgi:hypothetical protein